MEWVNIVKHCAAFALLLSLCAQKASAEEIRYVYSLSSIAPISGENSFIYQLNVGRRRCVACAETENIPGRPFGPDATEHWVGFQYGMTDRLALVTNAIFSSQPEKNMDYGSFQVEARYRIASPGSLPVDVALSGGYLREMDGTSVVQGKGAVARNWGPMDLTGNLQFEKAFASGRDPLDLFITAGNSYRVVRGFRAGIEYVGQDLEDIWEEEEAEGGVRHLVGPTLAVQAERGTLQLALSPSFVFYPGGSGFLLRSTMSYSF